MASRDGLVPILLGVVGLLVFAGGMTGIVVAVQRWRRERRAAVSHRSAIGRIVDRYLPRGSEPHPEGPRYTIDFTAGDGRVVRFIADSVGVTPKKVGDDVEVLYNPARPEDAFVRGGNRATAYILGIGGFVFTIVGLLMALAGLEQALR
jgi:hypothetical protein